MKKQTNIVVTFLLLAYPITLSAHDAWLAAKWNKDKTQVLISALVAEHFPNGDPIKGLHRFVEPRAHVLSAHSIALTGDPSDSTLLGSLSPAPSIVLATGVKQREIKFKRDLAERYLMEEIGLTKEEASEYLTPGVDEFQETYSRYLKTVVAADYKTHPKDTSLGLPLEIVLRSWEKDPQGHAAIKFRLLDKGEPSVNTPVRVLSNGKTTIVRTDSNGVAQAVIDPNEPVLLAHIKVTKVGDGRLKSIWTNLAVYRLE